MANDENTPPQTPQGEEEPQSKEQGQEEVPTKVPNPEDIELNEQGQDLAKNDKALHELLTRSLVDMYVGSEGTAYTIHEKLLCYHSPLLRAHFYSTKTRNTSYGLPDDDPAAFELLVGWLYSRTLSFPVEDKQVSLLLDLYLLAEKLQMNALENDCVDTVRAFYQTNETYPELRRIQYIYSNTEEDNPMREMMVGSVARYLTLSESIPSHWDKALRRDGQLAVDIIRAIQEWHLEGRSVPDARDGSIKGFSRVDDSEVGSRRDSINGA